MRLGVTLEDVANGDIPGVAGMVHVIEEIPADAAVAADLRMNLGAPVLHCQLLLLANAEPIGIRSTWLPAQRFRVPPHTCDTFVRSMLPTPEQALLLAAEHTPMLLFQTVSRDLAGIPVARTETLFQGDRVHLIGGTGALR